MALIARPCLRIAGVLVFADAGDPAQFYYCPVQPRLTVGAGGRPLFHFTKWRKDPALVAPGEEWGGGILAGAADLGVDAATRATIARVLRTRGGLAADPQLAPVPVQAATARWVFLDGTAGAAGAAGHEAAGYPSDPVTGPDHNAAFSVGLDMAAASLVSAMLDAPTSRALGLVYDLRLAAAPPIPGLALRVAWDPAIQARDAAFAPGGVYVAAAVDRFAADLLQQGVVVADLVTPADTSPPAGAQIQAAVRQLVAATLFRPSLPLPDSLPAGADTGGVQEWATPELAGATYTPRPRPPGGPGEDLIAPDGTWPLTLAPVVALADLAAPLAALPPDSYRPVLDLHDPDLHVRVALVGASGDDGVAQVAVHLDYGAGADAQDADVLLDAQTPEATVTWTYHPASGRTYRYRYEVRFAATAPPGLAGPLVAPDGESSAGILVIVPAALYHQARIAVVAARGFPFDRYPRVTVDFRLAGDGPEPRGTVTLGAATPSGIWKYRAAADPPPHWQYRVTLDPASAAAAWQPADQTTLIIAAPPGPPASGDPAPP